MSASLVGSEMCIRDRHLLAELFGPVVLDPNSGLYLGAEVASNNTGELCGICEALLWLRDCEPSGAPA
eukprot:6491212-Alexandrium_andersonii.AAC.1